MYKINKDRLIKTFTELAEIPSPSWKEEKILKYLSKRFKKLGGEIIISPCGVSSNLLVKFPGRNEGKSISFSAHMDTVQPCEKITPVVGKAKIKSDGTSVLGADDKSALAMFIEAMEHIKSHKMNHGPLEFLITCAEEVGLEGIKGFDTSLLDSKFAFVFDSGGDIGKIVHKAPYHSNMKISIKGRASHAGIAPEKGINAIRVLSYIITKIPSGRIDEETTSNVGIISGGRALNIVAEEAECRLEVRSIDKKKMLNVEKQIKETVKEVCLKEGVKSKIERKLEYNGFSIPENSSISQMAVKAMEKIGIKPEFIAMGGGSDTNILNRGAMKAVNLSCGMENIHSTGEYIKIKELIKGTELVLALIENAQ